MDKKLHWTEITDRGMNKLMRDLFFQDWQDNKNKKKESK